jgi:hypothetical protein
VIRTTIRKAKRMTFSGFRRPDAYEDVANVWPVPVPFFAAMRCAGVPFVCLVLMWPLTANAQFFKDAFDRQADRTYKRSTFSLKQFTVSSDYEALDWACGGGG